MVRGLIVVMILMGQVVLPFFPGNGSSCEYAPSPSSVRVPIADGSYSMFTTSLDYRNDPAVRFETYG